MRSTLKLIAEVRDLQIVDKDQRNCGICDDIELEGGPDGALHVKALLVGPAAIEARLPIWLARIVVRVCGRRLTRIPWQDVDSISSRIFLKRSADAYHLHDIDHRVGRHLAKIPALS
jgi:hypothetical protein